MFSRVGKNQGGMIKFVLNENIKFTFKRRLLRRSASRNAMLLGKPEMEIIHQMSGVITPGQRNDLDRISPCAQILDQPAIIKISTAQCVE